MSEPAGNSDNVLWHQPSVSFHEYTCLIIQPGRSGITLHRSTALQVSRGMAGSRSSGDSGCRRASEPGDINTLLKDVAGAYLERLVLSNRSICLPRRGGKSHNTGRYLATPDRSPG